MRPTYRLTNDADGVAETFAHRQPAELAFAATVRRHPTARVRLEDPLGAGVEVCADDRAFGAYTPHDFDRGPRPLRDALAGALDKVRRAIDLRQGPGTADRFEAEYQARRVKP